MSAGNWLQAFGICLLIIGTMESFFITPTIKEVKVTEYLPTPKYTPSPVYGLSGDYRAVSNWIPSSWRRVGDVLELYDENGEWHKFVIPEWKAKIVKSKGGSK